MTRSAIALLLLVAAAAPLFAQPPAVPAPEAPAAETVLEGTIYDVLGNRVPECRVVVRAVDGTEIFLSPPSGSNGEYVVELPGGGSYVIVAAVSPIGGRVPVTDRTPVIVAADPVRRDIRLPISALPGPRHAAKQLAGLDRLILAFVEDPLLVERWHVEPQLDLADYEGADRIIVRAVAAYQFETLPRVEIGGRIGAGQYAWDGDGEDEGLTDLDVWGKFHMLRASDGRFDVAIGAQFTLPTGDEDIGLGTDALHSKLFVALSRNLRHAAFVGHVGVRGTQDGHAVGFPLEGRVSASAGAGFVVPLSARFSALVEAIWEDKRFEEAEPKAEALAGFNWRTRLHETLRLGTVLGLNDGAPDVRLIAGYAWDY